MGKGVTPSGSDHSALRPEPDSRLGHSASVPDADTLIALLSAWNSMPGAKFDRAYPFFRADIQRIAEEYQLGLKVEPGHPKYCDAVALLFSDYADNLYWAARKAGDQ